MIMEAVVNNHDNDDLADEHQFNQDSLLLGENSIQTNQGPQTSVDHQHPLPTMM